jgi:CheY-like chemotaxis protein
LSEDKKNNSLIKVLIVEDNLVNQRVLAKQLKNIGMNVAVANHGVEALDYIRKTTYCIADERSPGLGLSLILMDWEMPVMNGLTCVREIAVPRGRKRAYSRDRGDGKCAERASDFGTGSRHGRCHQQAVPDPGTMCLHA